MVCDDNNNVICFTDPFWEIHFPPFIPEEGKGAAQTIVGGLLEGVFCSEGLEVNGWGHLVDALWCCDGRNLISNMILSHSSSRTVVGSSTLVQAEIYLIVLLPLIQTFRAPRS